MIRQIVSLLLLAMLIVLPNQTKAATTHHVVEYQTRLAANEVKVVLLSGFNLNPQVLVYANEKLQFKQKGPDAILTRAFIVLGPFSDVTKVTLKAHIDYPIAEQQSLFVELNGLTRTDIDAYRQLFAAVKLWTSNDTRDQAIALLQTQLQDQALKPQLKNETSYLLGQMLIKKKKISQGAKLLVGLASLSSQDLLLLHAQGKYWQREFQQAVVLQCQYIKTLTHKADRNKADRYQVTTIKTLLAQNLIEQRRGHKTEGFIELYLKHCQGVIDNLTPQPIEDARTMLEGLLVKTTDWHQPHFNALKGKIFAQLWNYHTVTDDHIEAEKMARLSILHVDGKNVDLLVSFYWNLGTSLYRQGRIRQAQQVWRKALVIAKQNSHQPAGASFFNLAYSYRAVGEYDLAKRYFAQTLVIDERNEGKLEWQKGAQCNKDRVYSAMTIAQLGLLARLTGELDDALLMQQCAEAVFDNTNEYYALVAKLEIAQIQLALENVNAAQLLLDQVLADKRLMQSQRLNGLLIALQIAIAKPLDSQVNRQVEALASQFVKSLDYQQLDFATDKLHQNYPKRQIKLFELLIGYYANKGDVARLEHFGEKALKLIEIIKQQVLDTQSWSEAQYAVLAAYIKGLYHTDSGQHVTKIFELLDRYYSINLNVERQVFQTKEKQDVVNQLNQLWQAKLNAERALIAASEDQQALLRAHADDANEQYLAFKLDNELSTNISAKPRLSLSQIQQQMPKDDIFVRYFIDDELSFALVLTKQQLAMLPLPSKQVIREQVNELNRQLFGRHIRQLVLSSPLSQLLPMLSIQSNQYQRIVIVADDTLHRVPFSLLNVASGGRYTSLSAKMAIVRTYSAQGFYNSQGNRGGSEHSIALFADPDFQQHDLSFEDTVASEGFNQWLNSQTRLPQTAIEAANIAKLFKQSKVDMALGKAATNQFLMSSTARNASILHIATHGYFNPKTPNIVGVLTSPPQDNGSSGFLGLEELLSLPFHSDLVVVSGCETMRGKYYKGSGTKSITRGLLAKGVKSVIGTLWKVADRPTAQFMTVFYRQLKLTKGDVASALQRTKQQFSQRGRYRHPKYWAGFVLTSTQQDTQVSF